MMDKSIAGQVYNIADLEKEIEAEVWNSPPIRGQRSVDFVPPIRKSASCRRKPLSANTKRRRKRSRGWAQS